MPALVRAAPLRVALDENYPPYVLRRPDGQLEGYSVDQWKLWQQKTGVKVDLIATSFAQANRMVQQGDADVIDPIFRTPASEARYDFSAGYGKLSVWIYAANSLTGIHDLASLKGFQVGVPDGNACEEKLRQAGITGVHAFLNYSELLAAATNQSIKLFCLDEYRADYYLYRAGLDRKYVKAFKMYEEQTRRAVRKGDAATLALVNRGFAELTHDEKAALRDKWLGRELISTGYARQLMQVLVALAALVLVLATWLASVRRAVRVRTSELERKTTLWHALVESSPDLVWMKNPAGVYIACNKAAAQMLGKPREGILGKSDDDLFDPGQASQFRDADLAALRTRRPVSLEEQVTSEGSLHILEAIKTPVIQPDGTAVGVLGVARDITDRRRQEETMRMANLIFQTSSEAFIVTDEANRIVGANPAFTQQTGYQLEEVLGSTPPMFGASAQDSSFDARRWNELLATGHWQGELTGRNKDGTIAARFVDIRLVRNPDGRVYRHVIRSVDITEQKLKDELIWKQTNFDAITGLPNRRLFLDRLELEIRKAHGSGSGLAVLLLDLDRFKEINDTFGHAKGDEVLAAVTARLSRCVPEGATIARLSGDMFALIASGFSQRLSLEKSASAVIDSIGKPLRLDGTAIAYLSASVGISVYPEDGTLAEDLVRNAEHAMYIAKEGGRGRFEYFTPSLQQQARGRLMLTNDLREALARNQLRLHYQPIVEVASGRICKAETLLRWHHPQHGMISPARFIPLAEESGLINQIGDWVLCEAIASADRWRRKFGSVVELSVNISPVQFREAGIPPWLERLVGSRLPPNSITVEITEGVLISDTEHVTSCLKALHAAGSRVSIDDFGTGFSALSYLQRFDIDYLKIDKSFVNHLVCEGSDKALTEAIIDIAHRLGIEAIAEGVETREQRDMLAGFGCDYIQGHFYSEAVPGEAFEDLLERQHAH